MEILNEVCEEIIGEEFNPIDYYECILKNVLDENVGTEEDGPSSIAVEMLKDFDAIIYDIKAKDYEAGSNETSKYVKSEGEYTYINTKAMIDMISQYNKAHGLNKPILEVKDFNKQIKKAGIGMSLGKDKNGKPL